jgi:hypothetical protein
MFPGVFANKIMWPAYGILLNNRVINFYERSDVVYAGDYDMVKI